MTRWFLFVLSVTVVATMASLGLGLAQDVPPEEEPDLVTVGPPDSPVGGSLGASTGPDVTVYSLSDIGNYGQSDGIYGYSVGTVSCNQGTEPLNWCDENAGCAPGATSADHPVIAQNLYRLKEGRFEQVGMSWLKHGFLALQISAPGCGDGSCDPAPFAPDQLGVGCTDPYGSSLNGSRPLGPRSEVNARTGEFPFPHTVVAWSTLYDQRVKVDGADVDPAQNADAKYWVEGQYVTPDDAQEGNGLNNASYRPVTVSAGTFALTPTGSTQREQSALYAWRAEDPEVEIVNVDLGAANLTQRFEAARRVTSAAGGYHYEMAIRNMNADVAARGLQVTFPGPVTVTDAGFHDIEHHSGEPYATTDWTIAVDGPAGTIRWFGEDFASNQNANALRWATTFTFWFDADRPPVDEETTLELFKPSLPQVVRIKFVGGTLFDDGFETGDTSAWSLTEN
jgi:hypothetical protein